MERHQLFLPPLSACSRPPGPWGLAHLLPLPLSRLTRTPAPLPALSPSTVPTPGPALARHLRIASHQSGSLRVLACEPLEFRDKGSHLSPPRKPEPVYPGCCHTHSLVTARRRTLVRTPGACLVFPASGLSIVTGPWAGGCRRGRHHACHAGSCSCAVWSFPGSVSPRRH